MMTHALKGSKFSIGWMTGASRLGFLPPTWTRHRTELAVDEAGLDILLRGGELAYSSNKQSAGLFAGKSNIVNIDILKQRFVDDPTTL